MLDLDPKSIASTEYDTRDEPRAINEVLAILDQTYLDPHVHARPTHYNIATSVVCNIKCVFCPRQTFGPEINSGFLKADFFEPVVPHLEAAFRTGLFGLGEALLNKRFFDFLKAAKDQGTYCMTSSHGMGLNDETIDKIIDHQLDELCISFDGVSKRTVNFLRNGADFDTILKNTRKLIQRRNERGLEKPYVKISFTVSKYNVWEMKKAVKLFAEMGADHLGFSNLVLDHPEHAHVSIAGSRIFQYNLNRALALAEELDFPTTYFYQIPFPYLEQPVAKTDDGVRYGCPDAWRALIVEKDGTMKPCCYLTNDYGNTKDGELMEQLNSKKAVNLRKTFTEEKYLNTCKGCGQFKQITPEKTQQLLDEAKMKIEKGDFSEPNRILLEEKLKYFQSLAENKLAVAV